MQEKKEEKHNERRAKMYETQVQSQQPKPKPARDTEGKKLGVGWMMERGG